MKKFWNLIFSKFLWSILKSNFLWFNYIKSLHSKLVPCSQVPKSNLLTILNTVSNDVFSAAPSFDLEILGGAKW